jgi:hypothetical protein
LKKNLTASNKTRRHSKKLHDGHGGYRFATTRLTHHAQRFAAVDMEINAVHSMQDAVIGAKVDL